MGVVAAMTVLQGLWWLLGEHPDPRRLWLIVPLTAIAAAAAGLRRHAPETCLAAATVVACLPLTGVGETIAGPVAVIVTLHSLSVRRTARWSASAAAAVSLAAAVAAALRGAGPRTSAGVAVLVAAAASLIWYAARRTRRRRAHRQAVATYRASADLLPAHVAAVAHRRLAAELHDVTAHRMTGVLIAATAALRLGDPRAEKEALTHAREAGRRAVDELDRLIEAESLPTASDLDELVAASEVTTYHRDDLSPERAALAYRVVRESLTNAARYAPGARTSVHIMAGRDGLTITVTDNGVPAAPRAADVTGADRGTEPTSLNNSTGVTGLGCGAGLAGLESAVREAGGALTAGPSAGGWRVHAVLPSPRRAPPPPRRATARDLALVVLAGSLSFSVVLLPSSDSPDLLTTPAAFWLLAPMAAHAAVLAWRRHRPAAALAAGLGVLTVWVVACLTGLLPLDPAELFLAAWWIELFLLYSLGADTLGELGADALGGRAGTSARRGWWWALAVAAAGGIALASGTGIHGDRVGAATVLMLMLLPLTAAACWTGRLVAARRRKRHAEHLAGRAAELRTADQAARSARSRLADGLRADARRHALAVAAAADDGRLADVRTHARASLTALRELVHRPLETIPEPPPGMPALEDLAARRRGSLTLTGSGQLLPAALEVTAYRAAALLADDGAAITVDASPQGLRLTVAGAKPVGVRPARHLLDEVDGILETEADHGTVRIWLPQT